MRRRWKEVVRTVKGMPEYDPNPTLRQTFVGLTLDAGVRSG